MTARPNRKNIRILILIASVLVLMMVLCGCRTRVTNNNEVSNVMYDESGWMQDEYQMRRDELSLGVAKKPLFTGFGAPEDDDFDDNEYYSGDAEMLEDYDPEAYEEEYVEEDEPETTDGSSSGSGTAAPARSHVIRRRAAAPKTPESSMLTVVLDANGGILGVDEITVRTGEPYGYLPAPEREGFIFTGWYTKSSGGTQITEETKVTATKSHKLYAQWMESSKNTFTVSFEKNAEDAVFTGGGEPVLIQEGGAYETLPTVVRPGFVFEGWFTGQEDGIRIQAGDAFTANADQTLFARWKAEDPYETWSKKFDEEAQTVKEEDTVKVYIDSSTKAKEKLVTDCRGNVIDSPDTDETIYVTRFIDNINDEKADEAAAEISSDEQYADKKIRILLIDSEALEGDNNTRLMYRLAILNVLYGKPDDAALTQAAASLGFEADLKEKIYLYE